MSTVAPLVEIEERVQERATALAVDPALAEGAVRLRELIDEEIARWDDDHRRGRRPFPLTDPAETATRAWRDLAGHGPLTSLLEDDDVWEIMINAPDAIFVKRHQGLDAYHPEVFRDDDHVSRVVTRILDEARGAHRKLDPAEGLQDAQLSSGARLHIVHADLTRGGHLVVNIRKFARTGFHRLDDLVAARTLEPAVANFLESCVRAGQTLVVSGPPGSGKTTLLACCADALAPNSRVVQAEEVFEVDIALANVAAMQTRAGRPDRPAVDLRRLVAGFLRMAPDVAIVGEVRDREALPLLLTLSSGVQGFTTIHSGSARQALTRLRFICQLSEVGAALPLDALNRLVADSIDLVVHCRRGPDGPRVEEVVAVEDGIGPTAATQFTVTDVFDRDGVDGGLRWSGEVPARLADDLARRGVDLATLLQGTDACFR